MRNGYKIDHITETIIVTKKFLNEAAVFGTSAYNTLVMIKKDFPLFTIKMYTREPRKYMVVV